MAQPAHRVSALDRYRLRLQRRRLLWRSFRSRHALTTIHDRTAAIGAGDVLVVACLRNEAARLPHWLAHYRALGAGHFLIVDNGSTDGTRALLGDQPDVSLWHTDAAYRAARFGLDWTGWLLMQYGQDHWCLTVDADEIFVYSGWNRVTLPALTGWLDAAGQPAFGALMLDLYPEGALGAAPDDPADPFATLTCFDPPPRRIERQLPALNLWVQGGVRERVFFAQDPRRSPTLNKLPLVRWSRRYTYRNSTHAILPPPLNLVYDGPGGETPSGVLLHTKFLSSIREKSAEEKARGQHFHHPDEFGAYYDALIDGPVLKDAASLRYEGWEQLEALGLMTRGGWL